MKKRILYLTFESIELSPIISTQVLPLLEKLSHDYSFELVTFENPSFKKPKGAKIEFAFYNIKSRVSEAFKLLKFIYSNNYSFDIIHIRSYLPMLLLLCISPFKRKKVPIIFDMRGVFPQELLMKNKHHKFSYKIQALYVIFEFLERYFLRISNSIVVVSSSFEEYLLVKYTKQNLKSKIEVIPTFTMPPISSNVNELEINLWDKDDRVFVYSGSLYVWQQFEKTVKLFKEISNSLSNCKLLVLTFEKREAEEIIIAANIASNDFKVITSKPEDLQRYLKQAQFAFLLRDNDIVNKVATPIKFSDYVQANLSIISSSSIGDTEKIINESGIGYIIPDLELETIKSFAKEFTDSFKVNGRKNYEGQEILKDKFSLESSVSAYLDLYKRLS